MSVQVWIPCFLFTRSVLLYSSELISFRNRYLMPAPHLPLMKGASKSLIILSDGQPFLPSDSHHSFPRLIDSSFSGLCRSAACQVHWKALWICSGIWHGTPAVDMMGEVCLWVQWEDGKSIFHNCACVHKVASISRKLDILICWLKFPGRFHLLLTLNLDCIACVCVF